MIMVGGVAAIRSALRHRLAPDVLLGTLVLAAMAGLAFAPVATLLGVAATALVWTLARVPFAMLATMVVCMGSVKVNLYLGFFTFFPEYLVLAIACAVGMLAWWSRGAWPPERHLQVLFAVWMCTGLLSVPSAPSVSKVLARVVLLGTAAVTFFTVIVLVRRMRDLRRAVALWQWMAALLALYGIVQMVGLVAGFDTSLHLPANLVNPDIYQGIGAPVRRRIGDVFRANAMFNDPNILGGYLAAAMTMTLALRLHHAETGRRLRAGLETAALVVMSVCLLLTQSRSGFLALCLGVVVVLSERPRYWRRPWLWVAVVGTLAVMMFVSWLLGADPTLLWTRFAGTADTNDSSNRQHFTLFVYAFELVSRFPFFGVGLGNFGTFYGAEQEPVFTKMMTHCAPLTYFAESGVPGGIAFLAVWWGVVQRLRRFRPPAGDDWARTLRIGLLGAVAALLLANVFYDYILRTFIWVVAAFAVCVPRLYERRETRVAG